MVFYGSRCLMHVNSGTDFLDTLDSRASKGRYVRSHSTLN